MSFDAQPALAANNISKCYHIYGKPGDRLKQLLVSHLHRWTPGSPARRYYEEFQAVKNVSLSADRGETIGIIGPNGAGKSTLLQIIAGTLAPTSGTVEVRGRVAALLELGSSFNPEFTGVENVFLYGAILGIERKEMENRLDAICRYADIGEYVHHPVKLYSSGMALRLAFAVIVHIDADILIIDEALTVGDAFFVQKCLRFLREFVRNGTILFVSHDPGTVVTLCSRAIWLHEGEIRMEGDPKTVSEEYLAYSALKIQSISDPEASPASAGRIAGPSGGKQPAPGRDIRLEYLNRTNLRNDLELFQFQPDSPSFGQRKARIVNVMMTDADDRPVQWTVGGENVKLCIACQAREQLTDPIVGFYVKNRLGQHLFGDNTFLTYQEKGVVIPSGEPFRATFSFSMPVLPVGEYSISAAIAVGTQDNHATQHWLHEALVFRAHASSVVNCLIGIPMTSIELTVGGYDTGTREQTEETPAGGAGADALP